MIISLNDIEFQFIQFFIHFVLEIGAPSILCNDNLYLDQLLISQTFDLHMCVRGIHVPSR